MFCNRVLLLAAFLVPAAVEAQVASPAFGEGSYTIEQRVKRDANPYAGTSLDFIKGGALVWNRDGHPFAMMQWELQGDMLRIVDAELCPLAPTALYRVSWQERGFVVDRVADDCHERAASASSMLMVPLR